MKIVEMYLFWGSYMYMLCIYACGDLNLALEILPISLILLSRISVWSKSLQIFTVYLVSLIWMVTVLTSRVVRIQVTFMPSWFDRSISNSNSNLYTYRQTLYPLSHLHKSRIWIILTCINIMQISINYLFRKFCFEGKAYRICNLWNNLYH